MAKSFMENMIDNFLVKALTPFKSPASYVDSGPLINEPFAAVPQPYGQYQPVSYFTLWAYYKDSPETFACVNVRVEDILSNGYVLIGEDENVKNAQEFLDRNNWEGEGKKMLFDAHVTGDGYIYINKVNMNSLKSFVERVVEGMEIKSESREDFVNDIVTGVRDENPDILTPRAFRSLPSSTVKIEGTIKGDVHQYVQQVGSEWRWFLPDEIIHFKLFDLDGKLYGFTPMQTTLKEMDTITSVKDYAKYNFERSTIPHIALVFPEEIPESPNMVGIRESLREFAQNPNKQRILLLTTNEKGAQKIDLASDAKDMEYRESARYHTQVIVNTWGVPPSRLPGLLLDAGVKSANIGEDSYYASIEHYQARLENLVNSRILKFFNVKMKINRPYQQTEMRKMQVSKQMTDIAEQRVRAGFWTHEAACKFLGIPTSERGEEKEDPTGQLGQGQMDNKKLGQEAQQKHENNYRKETQNAKKVVKVD